MAITRQTTQTLAAAELNDQYGVDVTVQVGREKLTVKLTRAEAHALSAEIKDAVLEAGCAAIADGEA